MIICWRLFFISFYWYFCKKYSSCFVSSHIVPSIDCNLQCWIISFSLRILYSSIKKMILSPSDQNQNTLNVSLINLIRSAQNLGSKPSFALQTLISYRTMHIDHIDGNQIQSFSWRNQCETKHCELSIIVVAKPQLLPSAPLFLLSFSFFFSSFSLNCDHQQKAYAFIRVIRSGFLYLSFHCCHWNYFYTWKIVAHTVDWSVRNTTAKTCTTDELS